MSEKSESVFGSMIIHFEGTLEDGRGFRVGAEFTGNLNSKSQEEICNEVVHRIYQENGIRVKELKIKKIELR